MPFITQMGVFGPPLIAILVVNVALTIRCIAKMTGGRAVPAQSLHAIPFWGGIAAVLGFLGQNTGLYHAFSAISRAREVSPSLVAAGFAESLSTTIFGLVILIVSAIAWFALGARNRKLPEARAA